MSTSQGAFDLLDCKLVSSIHVRDDVSVHCDDPAGCVNMVMILQCFVHSGLCYTYIIHFTLLGSRYLGI